MNKPSPHLVPDHGHGTRERGKSLYVSARDGLRLHVREYGSRDALRYAGRVSAGIGAQRRRL